MWALIVGVAGALTVRDTDELMLITNKGKMVRTKVSGIRETGRNAQGVILINMREGEILSGIAPVVSNEDEDETEDEGVAVSGKEQSQEELDGGGLAGAVGPEQAKDFAALDLQVQGAQGHLFLPAPEIAIDLRQLPRFNNDFGHEPATSLM